MDSETVDYDISNLPKEGDDLLLWTEFQKGSELAYAKIYQEHANALYCYGLKIVRNEALIRDCIQDLFVELWNKKHRLGEVKSIKSYLFKSIRRKIFSEISATRRNNGNSFNADSEKVSLSKSVEHRLIEKQEFDQQLQRLNKLMGLLTDKQREVIYLKYYSQLGYNEISEILNLSVKATYKLVGRAVNMLRKHWNSN